MGPDFIETFTGSGRNRPLILDSSDELKAKRDENGYGRRGRGGLRRGGGRKRKYSPKKRRKIVYAPYDTADDEDLSEEELPVKPCGQCGENVWQGLENGLFDGAPNAGTVRCSVDVCDYEGN